MNRFKTLTPKVRLVAAVDADLVGRLDAFQRRIRRKDNYQARSDSTIAALIRLALEEYLDARRA